MNQTRWTNISESYATVSATTQDCVDFSIYIVIIVIIVVICIVREIYKEVCKEMCKEVCKKDSKTHRKSKESIDYIVRYGDT